MTSSNPTPDRPTAADPAQPGTWVRRHRALLATAVAFLGFAALLVWPTSTDTPAAAPAPVAATTTEAVLPPPVSPRLGGATTTDTPPPATASTTSSSPTSTTAPTGAPAVDPTPTSAPGQWRDTATGFATEFARPGAGPDDWSQRLARWSSPALADSYRTVDPAALVTANLVSITPSSETPTSVDVVARYDTGLATAIRVQAGQLGWRVIDCEPVQQ